MSSLRLTKSQLILLLTLLIILIVVLAIAFFLKRDSKTTREPTTSEKIFSSTNLSNNGVFESLKGQAVSLEEYQSKTVVITTWASWCPPCQSSLVEANKLAQTLKDKNIDVLAVNRMEDRIIANAFLKTLPPLEHLKIVIDNQDRIFSETEGYAIPETTILNSEGEVVYQEHNTFTKTKILDTIAVSIAQDE